jgi:hypothetical protein
MTVRVIRAVKREFHACGRLDFLSVDLRHGPFVAVQIIWVEFSKATRSGNHPNYDSLADFEEKGAKILGNAQYQAVVKKLDGLVVPGSSRDHLLLKSSKEIGPADCLTGSTPEVRLREKDQCRLPETSVNVLVNLLPIVVTAPMMTTAINEAIRPYSIAVAPESSRTNFFKDRNICKTSGAGLRHQSLGRSYCSRTLEWLIGIAKPAGKSFVERHAFD